jgi:hypothetical protein
MYLRITAALVLVLAMSSCSPTPVATDKADADKLLSTVVIVDALKQKIDIGYPISAAVYSGVPVVLVDVEDPKSDYASTVQTIVDALGAVEGEITIVYESPVELTEADKESGMKNPKEILGRFDGKTGQKLH